jgi:hypothetical protein
MSPKLSKSKYLGFLVIRDSKPQVPIFLSRIFTVGVATLFVFAGTTLSFVYNSFSSTNEQYFGAWTDSEALVASKILADKFEVQTPHELGFMSVVSSDPNNSIMDVFILENHLPVRSLLIHSPIFLECGVGCYAISVPSAPEEILALLGRELVTQDGALLIHKVDPINQWITVSSPEVNLTEKNYTVASISAEPVDPENLQYVPYASSFGIQGTLLSFIYNFLEVIDLRDLKIMIQILSSASVVFLFYVTWTRIGPLMGAAVALSLIFSPWMTSLSGSLFWFMPLFVFPIAVSILWASSVNTRHRKFLAVLLFCTLTARFLMGYEFVSTLLLVCLGFGLLAIKKSSKSHVPINSRNLDSKMKFIFAMAAIGFSSFITALVVHASKRGVDVFDGLRKIFVEDVLRRTHGQPEAYGDVYAPSLQAETLSVVSDYIFNWSTAMLQAGSIQIGPFWVFAVTGLLSIGFVYLRSPWLLNGQYLGLAVIFAAPFSWLVLAKAHSYIHTHINFIIMYFGAVPVLIYLLLVFVRSLISVPVSVSSERLED